MADVIKIDLSFVACLGRSREDTAIVNASMALATSLRLRVVAEGVETFAQLDQLAALGCHYAQGFALSAPVPVGTAIRLWRAGKLFEPGNGGARRTGDVPVAFRSLRAPSTLRR
jgi:EAL domain-containing protein (putative c-di-GMP-specific phosphodiesterase class I)